MAHFPLVSILQIHDHIDRQRNDNRIKKKGKKAMQQRHPADGARRDLDIGNLERHPDNKCEIGKIQVIGP